MRSLSPWLRAAVAVFGILLLNVPLPLPAQTNKPLPQGLVAQDVATIQSRSDAKYVPGEVLVRFRKGTSSMAIDSLHGKIGATVLRRSRAVEGLQRIKLAEGTTVHQAVRVYRQDPNVLYAEPNYLVHALNTPNDPMFPLQWNLQNTGQQGGKPGADIHATQAWNLTTGSSSVVVAVLDTGVDYTHPDLAQNIWTAAVPFQAFDINGNPKTCPAGSHGFATGYGLCDPMDDNGHGTHVSGTIGALGNNSQGVSGINWQVQILPCKFLDGTGSDFTDAAIACRDIE